MNDTGKVFLIGAGPGDSSLATLKAKEMIEHGFEIMITGVSAEGLGKEWLGHILTSDSFQRLEALAAKFRFHVEGEGGEYETLVLSGLHMNGRLAVSTTVHWDGVRGHVEIH